MLSIIFVGAVLAAAISGALGFGGALLLLPLLTRAIGPETAIPVLTVAQLVGNLSRVLFGLRSIAWKPATAFLLTAVPASVAGSYGFVALPKGWVTRIIGVVLLLLVGLKASGILKFEMTSQRLAAAGAVVGFLSGLVGSAGPLGAAAFLALNLSPVAYIATEAMTAIVMHATKIMVYRRFIAFDSHTWKIAWVLCAGMIVGSWLGKKTVERLPVTKFRGIAYGLLFAVALQMIIFG